MRKQLVTMNPLALLTPDDRPQRKERERFEWTPEAVNKLLQASRSIAKRPTSQQDYSLLLETAIRTGLRLGELLGLQWRDLDLKQGMLYVRRQWTRDGTCSEPKTPAAIRQVPLAQEMVKKLAKHKLASDYSADEQPVFASSTGSRSTTATSPSAASRPRQRKLVCLRRVGRGSPSTTFGTPSRRS